ncbi:MAG: 50S ribosomal protein L9 [Alphaproteobacteria bacterium]|nr:50S ribosomal protein L9 [Alphaproteobacteria bacterium]
MSTQVILLERVEKLGELGDVVNVKPGYARNFLLPQKKALRANKSNVAYFEAQKKQLEAENEKQKKEAEKTAKKIEGTIVSLIRAASESGQLYGSVNSRDIANALSEKTGEAVTRSQVKVNQNYKLIGLFPVDVQLHPEVIVEITINIARSDEEAETQEKTGKALIADSEETVEEVMAEAEAEIEAIEEEALADVLEEGALEAEKERQAEAAEEAAEEAKKAEERAAKKAEKDAAKAAEEAAEEAEAAEGAEEAPAEDVAEEDKA